MSVLIKKQGNCWLAVLPSDLLPHVFAKIDGAEVLMQLARTSKMLLRKVSEHVENQLYGMPGFEKQWICQSLGRQLCRLHRLWVWGAAWVLVVGVACSNLGMNEFTAEIADALSDEAVERRQPFKSRGSLVVAVRDDSTCAVTCDAGDDDVWKLVVFAADRIPERKLTQLIEGNDLQERSLQERDIMLTGFCVPIDTLQTLTLPAYLAQPTSAYRATAMTTLRRQELERVGHGPGDTDLPRTLFKLYDGTALVGICRMHYMNPDHEYTNKGGPTLRKFKARDATCRLVLYRVVERFVQDLTHAQLYDGRIQLYSGVMQAHPRFWKQLLFKDTTGEGDYSVRMRDENDGDSDSEGISDPSSEGNSSEEDEVTSAGVISVRDSDGDTD